MQRYVFPLEIIMRCKTIGLCLSTKFLFKIIAKSIKRRFFMKSVLKKVLLVRSNDASKLLLLSGRVFYGA